VSVLNEQFGQTASGGVVVHGDHGNVEARNRLSVRYHWQLPGGQMGDQGQVRRLRVDQNRAVVPSYDGAGLGHRVAVGPGHRATQESAFFGRVAGGPGQPRRQRIASGGVARRENDHVAAGLLFGERGQQGPRSGGGLRGHAGLGTDARFEQPFAHGLFPGQVHRTVRDAQFASHVAQRRDQVAAGPLAAGEFLQQVPKHSLGDHSVAHGHSHLT